MSFLLTYCDRCNKIAEKSVPVIHFCGGAKILARWY